MQLTETLFNKIMSCNSNTEIMEYLFEQVLEEFPDITEDQAASLASARFWELAQ